MFWDSRWLSGWKKCVWRWRRFVLSVLRETIVGSRGPKFSDATSPYNLLNTWPRNYLQMGPRCRWHSWERCSGMQISRPPFARFARSKSLPGYFAIAEETLLSMPKGPTAKAIVKFMRERETYTGWQLDAPWTQWSALRERNRTLKSSVWVCKFPDPNFGIQKEVSLAFFSSPHFSDWKFRLHHLFSAGKENLRCGLVNLLSLESTA